MICGFSGIGEMESEIKVLNLECPETDVLSGVERQRTCEGLEQCFQKLTMEQQAKDLLNSTVLDNII